MIKPDNEDSQSPSKKKWEDIEHKHKPSASEASDQSEDLLADIDAKTDETSTKKSETKVKLELLSRQELENQLTDKEHQAEEYKQKMLRAYAEMENLRRRSEREVANSIKYGNDRLLSELLPVLDSLVRALHSSDVDHPGHSEVKNMKEGISLTLELFLNTLSRHGVEAIDPKPGDPFDPQLHEALSMQKHPEAKSNSILQIIQKGYQLNGRILRAAMVIVAA
jgi:molecular chaperone GrpE